MTRRLLRATVLLALLVGGSALPAAAQPTRHSHLTAPPVHGWFDYQIGGSYRPASGVQIVDRDRTSRPAPGIYSICYVNAFQTQPEDDRWWQNHHPDLLLRNETGALVEDPGWPGEYLLDTATAATRAGLVRIERRWVDGCASKGFRAVEPDNLDSYTRSHHLLTVSDNLAFAKRLVGRAHHDGLAIAQKNDAEISTRARRADHFDFAIAEECQVYDECSDYLHAYGRHVIEIEYTDNGLAAFRAACAARGSRISVVLRDRDVVPRGHRGYVDETC